ncbi:MAG: flagellar basal body P-ring formation chaperone FlgA [Minwuia sp.]|uniref:flagellar basal body P-ring formation chaperone FlgA n=1 Tax=Minwuia sp. TaxID=2493630 RepID=UPI003A86EFD2
MTRLIALLAALIILPAAANASREIEDATLRYDITVNSSSILLSDLLEGSPRAANITVTRAPEPGRSLALNPVAIAKLAAMHRIRWSMPPGLQRIMVSRASQIVDASLLQSEIEIALANAVPDEDLEIQFQGGRLEIHVPADVEPTVRVESLDYNPTSSRFTAIVSSPAGDPAAERHRITGRAWRMTEIPVLAERVGAGNEIEPHHIAWQRVRADQVRRQTVLDYAELIGMAPKRNIAPGRPIRQNDLRRPVMVAKGDVVTMIFRSGPLTLTAAGRAIEDGGRNAVIRVINDRSRLTIEGRIVAPGRIVVGETFHQISQLSN